MHIITATATSVTIESESKTKLRLDCPKSEIVIQLLDVETRNLYDSSYELEIGLRRELITP